MAVETFTVQLTSSGYGDVIDITRQVADRLELSGLKDGTVTIFTSSSTSAITTIEFESGAVTDLRRLFDEIAAPDRSYSHNARWGDGNGHSHVRAALLGPSLTVPFTDGSLALGVWQQIVFVDFDNRPRERELVLQLIGEN